MTINEVLKQRGYPIEVNDGLALGTLNLADIRRAIAKINAHQQANGSAYDRLSARRRQRQLMKFFNLVPELIQTTQVTVNVQAFMSLTDINAGNLIPSHTQDEMQQLLVSCDEAMGDWHDDASFQLAEVWSHVVSEIEGDIKSILRGESLAA